MGLEQMILRSHDGELGPDAGVVSMLAAPLVTTPAPRPVVPAVARAAAALDVMASNGRRPVGLSELSRSLGCPKSSLANILAELVKAGFVRRVESGFILGRRLAELGGVYLASVDIVQEFQIACTEVSAAALETVQLSVLDGLEVVYLGRHDGRQPVRFMESAVGRKLPATCTALGKASLAALPPDELEARLSGVTTLPRMTARSIQDPSDLRADLDEVRRRGYAIDNEETTTGVVCYAVAVPCDELQEEPYAVSVTILRGRATASLRRALIRDLHELAMRLHRV